MTTPNDTQIFQVEHRLDLAATELAQRALRCTGEAMRHVGARDAQRALTMIAQARRALDDAQSYLEPVAQHAAGYRDGFEGLQPSDVPAGSSAWEHGVREGSAAAELARSEATT